MSDKPLRDRIKDFRRVKASELRANPANFRRHPEAQRRVLAGVLEEIGYADALLCREDGDGLTILDGHLRAEITPDQEVPVLVLDVTKEEGDRLMLHLDPLAAMARVDVEAMNKLIEQSGEMAAELLETLGEMPVWDGDDLVESVGGAEDESRTLAERFGVPPFSVLDARQGYWQERKRAWLALGIQSEIGRGMCRPHGKDTRPVPEDDGGYSGGDCWKAGAMRERVKMALHNDPMQRKAEYDEQTQRPADH